MLNRILIILVIIVGAFWYANQTSKLAVFEVDTSTGSIITHLPDKSVKDLAGKGVSLREFTKNSISVIHFWATWCGPCEAEFPELVKLTEKILEKRKDVKFLFIAVNDQLPKVNKFLARFKNYKNNFSVLIDNDGVHKDNFGTVRMPETFIFSKTYDVIKKFDGPQDWESPYYLDLLKTI